MKLEKLHHDKQYRILYLPLANVKIHIFNGFLPMSVNSFIIETENNLVIIDTQLTIENAIILKQYANSLNKFITRIIVTHAHYDHYFGLPVFEHKLTYALLETIHDMQKLNLTNNAIPLNALTNTFIIDGLTYECNNLQNAHCPNHLGLYIKEINTLALGDLAQENVHLLAMNFPAFIKALTSMKNKYKNIKYLLTGHGKITTGATLNDNLAYMKTCLNIYQNSSNNEEFQNKVFETFPNLIKINPPLYYLFQDKPELEIK